MVSQPVSYNDHNTVSATIKFHIRHAKAFQRIMWQYDMTNFDGFRQKLLDVNWEYCFTSNDADTAAQAWTDMLMNAARECIPNKLVTVRPRDKPFFNGYLRRLRRSKERAHKWAKYDNTPEAWLAFRNQRGFYFSEIKRLKNEHTNHIQQTMTESLVSNPRKWWSLSKCLLNDKAPSIPALDENGTAVCDDTEKTQMFSEYFIHCSTLDISTAQLPSNYPSLTASHIGSWQTSVNDVINCLSKIDTSKAVGPDGINPKLLKEGAHQLAPIIERILFNVLFEYFQSNFLLLLWQSGFIPGHSTVTHLVEMYHHLCEAVSAGKDVRIVFCDISRGFDRVWHEGLLFKLEKCGISNKLLAWLKNYLQDRYQRVVINGQMSS